MATGTEVMTNFLNVLKNYSQYTTNIMATALDEAVRTVSTFDSLQESVGALGTVLFMDEVPEYAGLDSDARLQKATGMVLGADGDLSVDTGAISGSNAGGAVVKNAQDIVPESGDLSTAILPTAGSTTQITYTGNDGKSFTFNVKWPDSFTKFFSGTAIDEDTDADERLRDSRFMVDLNNFDPNEMFYANDFVMQLLDSDVTYGEMKNAAQTILKGLNTYWLKEGAKLIYDSYGLDFDGKTIEIQFVAGGSYDGAAGITVAKNTDNLPADNITIGINLTHYGKIDSTNPNGAILNETGGINARILYLDRVIAHEMVHAAMMASGTIKDLGTPIFFGEGIADLVQGDDDYNSEQLTLLRKIVGDSDTFISALSITSTDDNVYPAGDMLLRFIAKQSEDATIFVGNDSNKNQTINFNGNTTIVTNYDESNTINYNAGFQAVGTTSTFNDFVIKSGDSEGILLRDVRGKLISFNLPFGGNAYGYMATDSGEIDARNFNGGNNYQIIFGMDNKNNVIRAGNGGSYLWGGELGNDELYGGAGVDTFVYNINGGNDNVYNAESQDIVLLRDVLPDQFTRAEITDNGVSLSFTYGGTLNVFGQATTFVIENQATFTADYQTKTWRQVE